MLGCQGEDERRAIVHRKILDFYDQSIIRGIYSVGRVVEIVGF